MLQCNVIWNVENHRSRGITPTFNNDTASLLIEREAMKYQNQILPGGRKKELGTYNVKSKVQNAENVPPGL